MNFPDCEPGGGGGRRRGQPGPAQPGTPAPRRAPGRARQSVFLDRLREAPHEAPANGTDLWAIANRRIAVTPLRLDMTDEPTLTRFAQASADELKMGRRFDDRRRASTSNPSSRARRSGRGATGRGEAVGAASFVLSLRARGHPRHRGSPRHGAGAARGLRARAASPTSPALTWLCRWPAGRP